ncbi:MAG: ABC-ATPase domain-containing protein [Lachnospiraceae bacterium]|nr:ABC-ATPase domain-containing protein [Lachnospiraceae bacterium]
MKSSQELRNTLRQIDRKSYPAYKQLKGVYRFEGFLLGIDHVQGDPFAAPSRVSVQVAGAQAGFDGALFDTREKKIALEDYLLREFGRRLKDFSFQAKGSGKSGLMSVSRPGQEVLERTACQINRDSGDIILRLEIGFPANGRTVNSRELEKILFDFLPVCVKKSLFYRALDEEKVRRTVELAEDQTWLREQLRQQELVAFVANGSILPRESGVSSRPMKGAVPFRSPEEMEITLELPHHGRIQGMAIRKGITMIVGGGYHGKSTLLKALELGVYNHIAGDGREFVVTDETAMKLRAEDGRSVKQVDISLFINNLPNGKDTKKFVTEDASGSTSQAANVVEAMEAGSRVFLIDEDTSATNFMIRDELMQRVVHQEVEPITPFTLRVKELYEQYGISTVLVAGSSGSYFHVADSIVQMNQYEPVEITALAKKEAEAFPLPLQSTEPVPEPDFQRAFRSDRKFGADGRVKLKTFGMDGISVNRDNIDLRYVEQLADSEQLTALAQLMKYMRMQVFDGKRTLQQAVEATVQILQKKGWEGIFGGSSLPGNLAMPRPQEIFACVNRWRELG